MLCGRSNVGKSSLLNALTGVRGLARTSKTPGRTREIHFYEQGHDRFLVDLPGYGYARVSLDDRRSWHALVEGYLERADKIALAVLLLDARHPPFESDLALAASLSSRGLPFVIALTKSDKLGVSETRASLARSRRMFPQAHDCLLTSARTGAGIAELHETIRRSVGPASAVGGSRTALLPGTARSTGERQGGTSNRPRPS